MARTRTGQWFNCEAPACGKRFYRPRCDIVVTESRNSRVRFCSIACKCAESRSRKVNTPCLSCGKELVVSSARMTDGRGRYCSKSCQHQAKRKQPIPLACEACDKHWTGLPWQFDRRYCSWECAKPFVGHERMDLGEKSCAYCGTIFERRSDENAGNFRSRKTCSDQCRFALGGKTRRHGAAPGGPYAADFTRQLREEIRARDGYRCRLCGAPPIRRGLHVHHIDYQKDNTLPENLITLCQPCHSRTNFNRNHWHGILAAMVADDEAA